MNPYNHRSFYVYFLTNKSRTVIYIGITNDLKRRMTEHKEAKSLNSFTRRYNVFYLIYFENFDHPSDAINRETQLKKWNREKKEALIKTKNPEWKFLNETI